MNTSVVSPGARTRLRPLPAGGTRIVAGFWAQWQRINRERAIPHGFEQLTERGTRNNFRLAAARQDAATDDSTVQDAGEYQAMADSSGMILPFLDSDVYKWLEAAGWELGRAPDARLAAAADEAIAEVAAAQRSDGYINSYVQVVGGGVPHTNLAWSHEFYCVGHLVQAAVAWHRALGDDRLLHIAIRAVDRIDAEFGSRGRDGIDGHPCI
jgi:DUF1680 family protein